MYHGGYSDVCKGQYNDEAVAGKVVRVYLSSNPKEIIKVGCWWCSRLLVYINNRPRLVEVLQRSCGLEVSPSSKRAAPLGRYNDRELVRDGIGMDGEWEHQQVCEGESRSGSIWTWVFFIQGRCIRSSLTITRLLQLGDVVEGLIYTHDQGIIHGNLKGVGCKARSCLPARS